MLSSLNLAGNQISADGAQRIAGTLKVSNFVVLVILVPSTMHTAPQVMRAMTSLNLASNNLGAEGAKIVAKAIKVNRVCSCDHFGTIFMSI
jgi:hypothetical protein